MEHGLDRPHARKGVDTDKFLLTRQMDYSKWTFLLMIGSFLLLLLKGAILISRRLKTPEVIEEVN